MKNLTVNKKTVRVYDSIDEMPIINFQKYNKYLLIDSGIGSDVDDIDAHIARIAKFIKSNNAKKALQELQNMRQNMYMVNSEISPKYLAFAALIHSIDGEEVNDLSDDGLKNVLAKLKEIKHSKIIDFLVWLKKKVTTELEMYFPGDFVNPKEKDAYDKLKQRTLFVLDSMINGTDNSEQIETIDIVMLNMHSPKSYIGSESVEIKYDKQFESTCLLIAQKTNMDAKKMTVLQFYNAVDNIKQQLEAESKSVKRHKMR
jgi:hypothetical protein|nr:MAG TPA: hypothetical protein [Caudoviricetes sp.]